MGQAPSQQGYRSCHAHQHENDADADVLFPRRPARGDGVQELMKPSGFRRDAGKTTDDSQHAQGDQRPDHNRRRLMDVRSRVMIHTRVAVERQIGQAEHVKRRQKRADRPHAV